MDAQQTSDEALQYGRARQSSHGGHNPTPHTGDSSFGNGEANGLRLDLLGSPQVCLGDQPIVLRTRKTLALLVYLAIEHGPHQREQMADLFWPEAEAEDGRASLRTTLSYVRQPLGVATDTFLLTTRESVGLQPSAPLDLDVQALADAQQLVRQAQRMGTPSSENVRLQIETAVERYRGPFLAGVSLPDAPDFEAWLEGQRTHWSGVQAELLDGLATLQTEAGDWGAAASTLERWTRVNPDEEAAWRRLIELQLRQGDEAGARRTWKAYREVLAELEAEPSAEMSDLAARIGRAGTYCSAPEPGFVTEADSIDLSHMPFVGRARELGLMHAAYERSQNGRTEVVVLEGETGIGKSRLVSEFVNAAQSAGADILAGRAFDTVGELPYAAVVGALRTRLEEENAPDDLLGDLWLAELARLVPELRERYPDLPAPADDSLLRRGQLFEAVARFGQALAARSPLVLFLDDLQWIDAATLDLVHYLVRRWAESGTPVLVLLTVRSESLATERGLAQWLAALGRETSTLRLELGPLQQRDVLQLIRTLTGPSYQLDAPAFLENGRADSVQQFSEWLANRTGGHPSYLGQALGVLLEDGILRLCLVNDRRWVVAVPETIEDALDERLRIVLCSRVQSHIAERMNQLSDVEANVLVAAAVLNGGFTDQRLIEVASVDEDEALRALDVLVRERLLRVTEEDEGYDFRHSLVREAVYAEAGRARQRTYERRALATVDGFAVLQSVPVRQAVAV